MNLNEKKCSILQTLFIEEAVEEIIKLECTYLLNPISCYWNPVSNN